MRICSKKGCSLSGKEQTDDDFFRRTTPGGWVDITGIKRQYACKTCFRRKNLAHRQSFHGSMRTLYISCKHRCEKRKWPLPVFDHVYLKELWEKQDGKCALTGRTMTYLAGNKRETNRNPDNVSLDRIDSKKSYLKDNIQLVTCWAQFLKVDLPEGEFVNYLLEAAEFQHKKSSQT